MNNEPKVNEKFFCKTFGMTVFNAYFPKFVSRHVPLLSFEYFLRLITFVLFAHITKSAFEYVIYTNKISFVPLRRDCML